MVTVSNKVGTLSKITEIVSGANINLVAICGYAIGEKGFINFVTEDNKRVKKLLQEKKFDAREEEVVVVSLGNKPGALKALSDTIANAGIDLVLMYGSVNDKDKAARLVLVSEDNKAVLSIIRLMQ